MKKRFLVWFAVGLFGLMSGCENTGSVINVSDGSSVTDARSADDARTLDVANADQGPGLDKRIFPELPVEVLTETIAACEGPLGCMLDPCEENADCASGFCIQHLGDGVCTQECIEECPEGWECKNASGFGADLIYLCVSRFAQLCQPCVASTDCTANGIADVCVPYPEGNFCGASCNDEMHCLEGYSCEEVETVEGVATLQCVANDEVCTCSEAAAQLGLSTTCSVSNEYGTCSGKLLCVEGGSPPALCDAGIPSAEVCNGVDDNCDGVADEVGCDDANPCTEDVCDGELGCQYKPAEGNCSDGDACTLTDHCDNGECVGTPINCNDGTECTDDICDEMEGCIFNNNALACDDDDPCTFGDQCANGECMSGVKVSCDDGNPCTKDVCDDENGCLHTSESGPCEDNNPCTTGDHCFDGKCVWDDALDCDDANPCTTDLCSPDEGCQHLPNSLPCDDSSLCTQGDKCGEGECTSGNEVDCDDSNPCTADSCNALVGCVHTANQDPCNDGDPCTTTDQCSGGSCVGTGLLACDDENPCTNDFCQPMAGCSHGNNQAPCDDGSVCTTGDKCAGGSCVPGVVMACDDANPCTKNGCDPVDGCTYAPEAGECSDNNECTTGDHCAAGACVGDAPVDCDDDNPCTTDKCLPNGGCQHLPWEGPCSDGDVCTGLDKCLDGSCVAGEKLDCDDGNPCTDDSCDGASGCKHSMNQAACDDSNACTEGDICKGGVCGNSGPVDCDDQNVCTTDSCNPDDGCVHALNTLPCDDDDICTIKDACQLGECASGGELNCNDGNPCTDDSCDPDVGCQFTPNASSCDDGNSCTEDDACSAGQCLGETSVVCEDDNLCTTDTCAPKTGCLFTNNSVACDDGNACTTTDACSGGECVGSGSLACNDGKVCTDDSCNPDSGCVYTNNVAGCDDGNPCTTTDVCANGICTGSGSLTCEDGNVCTDDSCDPDSGCVFTANGVACDDNSECTTGDICANKICTGPVVVACNDGDDCTTDTCSPQTGCVYTPTTPCCGNGAVEAGEECDDGNTVGGDGCSADCKTDSTKHYDGWNFFYNQHGVDTHNKQRAIEACQNRTGQNCSDGYGQCGNAHYVSNNTACSCNGAYLWYYGVDNGGFIWGGDVAGGVAVKCSHPNKSWY